MPDGNWEGWLQEEEPLGNLFIANLIEGVMRICSQDPLLCLIFIIIAWHRHQHTCSVGPALRIVLISSARYKCEDLYSVGSYNADGWGLQCVGSGWFNSVFCLQCQVWRWLRHACSVHCRVGMVNVCSMKCVMFQRAYSAASCSVSLGKDG